MPQREKMPSYVYLNQLLKVWVSLDPEQWMPMVNQLRLIRFLENNPQATVNLLVYRPWLSDNAQAEMAAFARKYPQLNIVDYDVLSKTLTDENDKKLDQYARQELAVKQPAAFRDIVTAISEVAVLGHYSDFDTFVKLKDAPSEEGYVLVHTPPASCLMPIYIEAPIVSYANDILVITTEKKLPVDSSTAKIALTQVQKQLIARYANPLSVVDNLDLGYLAKYRVYREMAQEIHNQCALQARPFRSERDLCWVKMNLPELRQTIFKRLKDSGEVPENVCEYFLKQMVIYNSGPHIYGFILEKALNRDRIFIQDRAKVEQHDLYRHLGKIFYSPAHRGNNNDPENDFSWLESGKALLLSKEKDFNKAAQVIQGAWKKHQQRTKNRPN